MKVFSVLVVCTGVLLFMTMPALAVPMIVNSQDTPSQDVLVTDPDLQVHELGNQPPFPTPERILSSSQETPYRPCLQNEDLPGIPNMAVTITNMTGRDWPWLYYVADPETGLKNDDGLVNGELAFQIDNVGTNRPLISESMNADGIFEWDEVNNVGETWVFVIQDYTNTLALPAHLFGSIGVGSFSGGDFVSSGSIIPEPATLSLLVLGGLALLRRRR